MRRKIIRAMSIVSVSICLVYGIGRATYYGLIAPENNLVREEIEEGWTPDSAWEPTLDEYLTYNHCGACVYNCPLCDPQCKRGIRLKKNATKEYNELYGQTSINNNYQFVIGNSQFVISNLQLAICN